MTLAVEKNSGNKTRKHPIITMLYLTDPGIIEGFGLEKTFGLEKII